MIYAAVRAGLRLLARIILGRRLSIDGMRHIPRRGAVIIVGNHIGTVEPPLTGIFIPRLDVYYMAKSELFAHPVLGWLFRHNHTFPVVRNTADRASLRFALKVLREGHVLLVYPEGSRSWGASPVGHTHAGAGFIARHSGALIVPVASWGGERVIPRGAWMPRRADVFLRIGEAFHLPSTAAESRPLSNQEAAEAMMQRVIALLPDDQRPVPHATAPAGERPPAA